MKKDFFSLPFMLGISVIGLVVVIAAVVAVAVPCDGTVPANKKMQSSACLQLYPVACVGLPPCPSREPKLAIVGNPPERYWGKDYLGLSEGFWVRADVGGSVECGGEYYCLAFQNIQGQWFCGIWDIVKDILGNPIVVRRNFYISIGCDPVV